MLCVRGTIERERWAEEPVSEPGTQPPIGDYGLISDLHSCALVSTSGSIDWACFPRFDSPAVFARLLDWERGGYFRLAPEGVRRTTRRYLPGTKVLETTFETAEGEATLTDFMPVDGHGDPHDPRHVDCPQQIVRILRCTRGSARFRLECCPRFEYGSIIPHVSLDGAHSGVAHGGADALSIYCSAPLELVEDDGFRASGELPAGEAVVVSASYRSRFTDLSTALPAHAAEQRLRETTEFWERWAAISTYDGAYGEAVQRSALTLKALTHAPTGAMLAAATTSLPEAIGGPRNWDYRFTWLRDASFALYALNIIGYREEAMYFKDWLEWATAGRARDLQLMYGLGGERRLTEQELPHLEGYRGSRPVRIGNGAYHQFQLDVFGEVMDSAHLFRKFGGEVDPEYWQFLRRVVDFVHDHWREPDEGIWEARSERQHHVFSKVMCWVAIDRAIRAARALGLPGDVDAWRALRSEIRADVLEHGFDAERGTFVQAYGSRNLDASALMLPLVGFVRPTEPRMLSTIRAIEAELTSPEGLVYRYRGFDDGLAGDEGAFVICTFWLADNLILLGETDRARELFEMVLSHGNDLGLLSEEIEPATGALLGNYPQAFSHMGLINTAVQLDNAARGHDDPRAGKSSAQAAEA
jgi:GH15 family glucan-1,4-alpha-glucosidase